MAPPTLLHLTGLAWSLSPFLLGVTVGFGTALAGIWRWFAGSTTVAGRDIVAGLRRQGLQSLALGLVFTWAGALWLCHSHAEHGSLAIFQTAFCGYPAGVLAGLYWVYRRGKA